jgi:hypothetical protein
MVPIFRKFAANSELFNKNLRKGGAISPLLRPIHPKSDRLLARRWSTQSVVAFPGLTKPGLKEVQE